jgi:hypothetical protein
MVMRGGRTLLACALIVSLPSALLLVTVSGSRGESSAQLRPPSDFDFIADFQARSRALFAEAAKVIMSPRCVNCHPASDRPTQGNDMHLHFPPVARGDDGGGVPGNTCTACHMERNVDLWPGQRVSFESIPGHPRWGLAPIEMAWEGKSMSEICQQLKDPQRNGGRSLALLHDHLATTILWAGAGIPAAAVSRCRGRSRDWAS